MLERDNEERLEQTETVVQKEKQEPASGAWTCPS